LLAWRHLSESPKPVIALQENQAQKKGGWRRGKPRIAIISQCPTGNDSPARAEEGGRFKIANSSITPNSPNPSVDHSSRKANDKLSRKVAREKNKVFQKLFKLPKSVKLIDNYSCALEKKILLQGRLYEHFPRCVACHNPRSC
jgi:hypothetical protein